MSSFVNVNYHSHSHFVEIVVYRLYQIHDYLHYSLHYLPFQLVPLSHDEPESPKAIKKLILTFWQFWGSFIQFSQKFFSRLKIGIIQWDTFIKSNSVVTDKQQACNYWTGRKQPLNRQETTTEQAGNNHWTARKQLLNSEGTTTEWVGSNYWIGGKQPLNRWEATTESVGSNKHTNTQFYGLVVAPQSVANNITFRPVMFVRVDWDQWHQYDQLRSSDKSVNATTTTFSYFLDLDNTWQTLQFSDWTVINP